VVARPLFEAVIFLTILHIQGVTHKRHKQNHDESKNQRLTKTLTAEIRIYCLVFFVHKPVVTITGAFSQVIFNRTPAKPA